MIHLIFLSQYSIYGTLKSIWSLMNYLKLLISIWIFFDNLMFVCKLSFLHISVLMFQDVFCVSLMVSSFCWLFLWFVFLVLFIFLNLCFHVCFCNRGLKLLLSVLNKHILSNIRYSNNHIWRFQSFKIDAKTDGVSR